MFNIGKGKRFKIEVFKFQKNVTILTRYYIIMILGYLNVRSTY